MRELSLFSGAGGGLLGTKLLGWRTVGYVEWNDYCQRVLAQRIDDGYLDRAPIFGDVRQFVESGAAREYRGFADVVTGGFPCQPFSVAGKQLDGDDPRNMWPATRDVIRDVRPAYVLLENVARLALSGYAAIVTADLASMGYVGRNAVLSADAEGANHERERIWFVAHANGAQRQGGRIPVRTRQEHADTWRSTWWQAEPGICRVDDGVANRMDRLKAIGNGQVPAVVVRAWEELA